MIYKENSVLQILNEKAASRVLRGHFIIDQCLSTLIAEKYTTIQKRYYTEIWLRQFVFKITKRRNKHWWSSCK